jgi:mono/diheme cytochrome c family protein
MIMLNKLKALLPLVAIFILASCGASGDNPGLEYAPQMYHSIPYEPLTQIKDKDRGEWLSNREDGLGEFYNSNPNNQYEQNVRQPVAGTVRRTSNNILPYRIAKDDVIMSDALVNPLDDSPEILAEGKRLYEVYCQHCHGEKGDGQGLVGVVYAGVPPYNRGAVKDLTEGHVFHVITHGIRRMGAHGSQVSPEKRWKIVKYVQQLQNQ